MLSCVRYGDINYFAACFLTVTGRRGSAYAYSSRVYDDISTSACASVRGVTTLPISTPPDVVKVPISLPIIIVSEDPCKKFIDIYAAPNALLPSRTDIGDYVFTSPRTGFGVVAPTKRRAPALASTTSFFNNAPASASPRRIRHAPVLEYHRGRRARALPFPSLSQPTPASSLSPADLDNDYDSLSDSPDNPHRRSYYTNGVFISVPDNPVGVPDNPRKRDFHRCTSAVLGG